MRWLGVDFGEELSALSSAIVVRAACLPALCSAVACGQGGSIGHSFVTPPVKGYGAGNTFARRARSLALAHTASLLSSCQGVLAGPAGGVCGRLHPTAAVPGSTWQCRQRRQLWITIPHDAGGL